MAAPPPPPEEIAARFAAWAELRARFRREDEERSRAKERVLDGLAGAGRDAV